MGKKDPKFDEYIEAAQPFARPVLKHLRRLVHQGCPDVVESWKWGSPHFDYKGIFCGMASFKQHCTFGFWKHSLLRQRFGELRVVEEKAMGSLGRITGLKDLPSDRVLLRWIKEAARLNDEGIKVRRKVQPRKPLPTPDDLAAALRKNRKALAAFEAFPPSHRREYIEWITEARTDATRQRRLETAVEWMAEGKSRNWKYMEKQRGANAAK